jgi:DNA mismatch endonuclease (patch repair protein)
LPKYRTVIFVNGCFWHQHPGCAKASLPQTHKAFWGAKLTRNVERDRENAEKLGNLGWNVLVVWECELKDTYALSARLCLQISY